MDDADAEVGIIRERLGEVLQELIAVLGMANPVKNIFR